jgi:hypothetical protein
MLLIFRFSLCGRTLRFSGGAQLAFKLIEKDYLRRRGTLGRRRAALEILGWHLADEANDNARRGL